MTNKVLVTIGVILGVPAAIFTTIEIMDRLGADPEPTSETIRIGTVTKIKWPGHEPPPVLDETLVSRVALECDGKRNCQYDHVFSSSYIGRIAVDWECLPSGDRKTKEFQRSDP